MRARNRSPCFALASASSQARSTVWLGLGRKNQARLGLLLGHVTPENERPRSKTAKRNRSDFLSADERTRAGARLNSHPRPTTTTDGSASRRRGGGAGDAVRRQAVRPQAAVCSSCRGPAARAALLAVGKGPAISLSLSISTVVVQFTQAQLP